jgi:tetrahydromethanopterin S-methyltransferase subunit E
MSDIDNWNSHVDFGCQMSNMVRVLESALHGEARIASEIVVLDFRAV